MIERTVEREDGDEDGFIELCTGLDRLAAALNRAMPHWVIYRSVGICQ